MKHKDYQEKILLMMRKATKLPGDATVAQVVESLLNVGEKMEAVELLFATKRDNDLLRNDSLGQSIFIQCMIADNDLLKAIANNHKWSGNNHTKGFAIQIYPGRVPDNSRADCDRSAKEHAVVNINNCSKRLVHA